jgi:hypothetical protein
MDDYGFAHSFGDFAARIAHRHGWPDPGRLPHSNVTGDSPWRPHRLTSESLRLLDDINKADSLLYRAALLRKKR